MTTQSLKLPKHKFDFSHRPDGWKSTLEVNDIQWIAQSVFAEKGVLVSELKMWWYPPQLPGPNIKTAPVVDSYFHRRIFLWMPRKMWAFDFKCPNPICRNQSSLTSKGLHLPTRLYVSGALSTSKIDTTWQQSILSVVRATRLSYLTILDWSINFPRTYVLDSLSF